MGKLVYQIKVDLRKRGGTVASVAGRASDGSILRTAGVVACKEDISKLVESAVEAVGAYDPDLHKRVHDLATIAALTQQGEYTDKAEK